MQDPAITNLKSYKKLFNAVTCDVFDFDIIMTKTLLMLMPSYIEASCFHTGGFFFGLMTIEFQVLVKSAL